MVRGGSGLCRTTQVRFIVLSLFMYISASPIISVTGSAEKNSNRNIAVVIESSKSLKHSYEQSFREIKARSIYRSFYFPVRRNDYR